MAEVVSTARNILTVQDLNAMVEYLASMGMRESGTREALPASSDVLGRGAKLLPAGQCDPATATRDRAYLPFTPLWPATAPCCRMTPSTWCKRSARAGSSPSTAGNPQPFGMPPSDKFLDDEDIAAVTTYIRQAWGNAAPAVSAWMFTRSVNTVPYLGSMHG